MKPRRISLFIAPLFGVLALGVSSLPQPVQAAVYNNQLIDNSGFERVSTIIEDWNCVVQIRLTIYPYSSSQESCSGYQLEDENARSGEVSLALGTAASDWYRLRYSISQLVTIPEDAAFARLTYDYQWQSTDAGVWTSADPSDVTNLMLWDQPRDGLGDIMNESYSEPFSRTSAEPVTEWRHKKIDLRDWRGHQLNLIYSVWNNDSDTSSLILDNVKVRVASTSRLLGTVRDESDQPLAGARVKIKNKAGKILWEGKTNNQGEFDASGLRGSTIKRRLVVYAEGEQQRFIQRIKWGKRYERSLLFAPAN